MSEQKIQVGDVWLNADGYEVRIEPGDSKGQFDAVRIDGKGVYTVNASGWSGRMLTRGDDLVRLVSRATPPKADTIPAPPPEPEPMPVIEQCMGRQARPKLATEPAMTELQRQLILHQLIDLQKRVETTKQLLGQAKLQLVEREYAVARMRDVCMACGVEVPE